jgi:hypothetical protein
VTPERWKRVREVFDQASEGAASVEREAPHGDVVGRYREDRRGERARVDLDLGAVELRQDRLVSGPGTPVGAGADRSSGAECHVVRIALIDGLTRAVDRRSRTRDGRKRARGRNQRHAVRQGASRHVELDRVRRAGAVLGVEERLPERARPGIGRVRDGESPGRHARGEQTQCGGKTRVMAVSFKEGRRSRR